MQRILTVNDVCLLIKKVGISEFIKRLMDELRKDFSRWHEFNKIPRLATHYHFGVQELMPIGDDQYYAFKYVNGHPKNPLDQKLTVVAVGMLTEVKTGYPLLVSEMTLLTAFRTAAVCALASVYLAPKQSTTLAMIGTGSQSEFMVLAHQEALGISRVQYYDIDSQAMEKFKHNLAPFELELMACRNEQETVDNADVITTITAAKKRATVLQNQWLPQGVHINGVGGDCPGKTELDPEILQRSKIVVEYLEQAKIEGEIQNLSPATIYAELWQLIAGEKPGRESADEITLFDAVGFALEDYTVLRLVYELAQQYDIGESAHLVPELDNPKNLFGLLCG